MDAESFVEWSAAWLFEDDAAIWRLVIDFEEGGVNVARTQIDCKPNPQLVVRWLRRAEQGLAFVGEALIRECVRGAVDAIQHQPLTEDMAAENHVTISLGDGMAADVRIESRRIGGFDGNDKILYLKEVPRIVEHLHKEAYASLSPSQRKRADRFYEEKKRRYVKKKTATELPHLILSQEDPYYFFVDETGDPGFKPGSSKYYTVAYVAIRASRKKAVDAQLQQVRHRHMPSGKAEIKFADVDRYGEARRKAIYRECIEILRRTPLTIYATAVHKDGFVNEKVRSRMAMYYYGGGELPDFEGPFSRESIGKYPKEMLASWGTMGLPPVMMRRMIEDAVVGQVFYDRAQWDWKNDLLKQAFQEALAVAPRAAEVFFGVKCDIPIPLSFPHSHEEPILWLAELAAREVNKHLTGNPSAIDEIAPQFAGAGPFPGGHFISLADRHGRYTFYNLITKRIELILSD